MKYEKKFKLLSRVGVVVYLLGTCITAFYYITDGPSSPLLLKDVANLLGILFIISITTSIFISKTNHRYTLCFTLMMLSSIFFVFWITQSSGILNSWHGDIIKVGIYSLISNIPLIISIIYSYKKYEKVNVHNPQI